MTEQNLWSSKPFISLDGVDENGIRAEVKVIKGCGLIKEISGSDKGKAVQVKFDFGRKHGQSAWLPKDKTEAYEKITKAHEQGLPIEFRLEIRRKPSIDRSLPFDEFCPPNDMTAARDTIFKNLAAVKFPEDDKWALGTIVTRMEDDPKTHASGVVSAYDSPPAAMAPTVVTSAPDNSFEPAPYVTYMRDGSVNPGSYAAAGPLRMYTFLAQNEIDNKITDVNSKQRLMVAKTLMQAANQLQLNIFGNKLEEVNPSSGSHMRAREIVMDIVKLFDPVPAYLSLENKEEAKQWRESLQTWRDAIIERGTFMWKWSVSEIEKL